MLLRTTCACFCLFELCDFYWYDCCFVSSVKWSLDHFHYIIWAPCKHDLFLVAFSRLIGCGLLDKLPDVLTRTVAVIISGIIFIYAPPLATGPINPKDAFKIDLAFNVMMICSFHWLLADRAQILLQYGAFHIQWPVPYVRPKASQTLWIVYWWYSWIFH